MRKKVNTYTKTHCNVLFLSLDKPRKKYIFPAFLKKCEKISKNNVNENVPKKHKNKISSYLSFLNLCFFY